MGRKGRMFVEVMGMGVLFYFDGEMVVVGCGFGLWGLVSLPGFVEEEWMIVLGMDLLDGD